MLSSSVIMYPGVMLISAMRRFVRLTLYQLLNDSETVSVGKKRESYTLILFGSSNNGSSIFL